MYSISSIFVQHVGSCIAIQFHTLQNCSIYDLHTYSYIDLATCSLKVHSLQKINSQNYIFLMVKCRETVLTIKKVVLTGKEMWSL